MLKVTAAYTALWLGLIRESDARGGCLLGLETANLEQCTFTSGYQWD